MEQLINRLRALARIAEGNRLSELSDANLAFIEELEEAVNEGGVTPQLVEKLLEFMNTNRQLIETDLPQPLIDQEKRIRGYILRLIARGLNTAHGAIGRTGISYNSSKEE